MLAVLDTMMEPLEDGHNTYIVYYNILDGDGEGWPPNDQHFNKSHKTCLHKIAKSNNKATICMAPKELRAIGSLSVLCSYYSYYHAIIIV